MRILLIILISTLINECGIAQSGVYNDTLEVEVGEHVKIVFLAESVADFEQLNRYDLNFLFDELWRMRQAGLTGEESLSRKEAEQLRRGNDMPDVNSKTKARTKPRFANWYFNSCTGLSFGSRISVGAPQFFLTDERIDQVQYSVQTDLRSMLSSELSVGNSLILAEKENRKLRLRMSVGIVLARYRIRNVRQGHVRVVPGIGGLSPEEISLLTSSFVEESYDRKLGFNTVFTELLPRYEWKNKRKEGHWNAGLGIRAGLAFNDINEEKIGTLLPIYSWGASSVSIYQPEVQYAIVGQIGYSFANFFIHYYPEAFETIAESENSFLFPGVHANATMRRSHALWLAGMRYGF